MVLPLLRLLLRPPAKRASALIRAFAPERGESRERLEAVVAAFLGGYRRALAGGDLGELARELEAQAPAGQRGFAFEGAGMGLRLTDAFTRPARRRCAAFLRGPGAGHDYLIHVGIGWAQAKLPGDPQRGLRDLEPLLRPLAFDGLGFHQGFFRAQRYHVERSRPRLAPAPARAFDQGLGRSLWFVHGASPERAAEGLAGFAPERRADLWSGLGLACAYAGGADDAALRALREAAAEEACWFEQGVAFAAAARQRAGDPAAHTQAACGTLLGADAALVGNYVEGLRGAIEERGADEGSYADWRASVAHGWAAGLASAARPRAPEPAAGEAADVVR